MQLKKIKGQMAAATCALLQVATPAVNAAENDWDVDTAFLYYGEGDGRVQAAEPAIYAGRNIGDDDRIDLRLVVDALTGATPNGAYKIDGVLERAVPVSHEHRHDAINVPHCEIHVSIAVEVGLANPLGTRPRVLGRCGIPYIESISEGSQVFE